MDTNPHWVNLMIDALLVSIPIGLCLLVALQSRRRKLPR